LGLAGDPPDPRSLPGGCAFHPRCPLATDTCTSIDPPLEPVGAARQVACLHADEDRDMKRLLVQQVVARREGHP
jgi:hypothetical protein